MLPSTTLPYFSRSNVASTSGRSAQTSAEYNREQPLHHILLLSLFTTCTLDSQPKPALVCPTSV
eukprot:1284142-Amphidinium_carterae.1